MSQGFVGSMPLPWQPLGLNSQMEGNSTSSVPTCSLQKDGSSPERVSGSTRWFQNCIPGIHSLQSHWERKYVIEKDPLPTEPEQENNGRWRKDNTRASLSMGGGFSTEGNSGISFNLISTPCQGFQTCLPVWSKNCNGHILELRPGSREDSGTRVLVCPICGISTLNKDTSLEKLYCH